MKKGISIHIGVDELDLTHYKNTGFYALKTCKNDARDMAQIVPKSFARSLLLLDQEATTATVSQALKDAAAELNKSGGILILTYSGHGGRVKDIDGTEGDGRDETWCLYDRQFLDDELFELWTHFTSDVRIVVISDSCNNGTVTASIGMDISEMLLPSSILKEVNVVNIESKILNAQGYKSVKYDENLWERDKKLLNEAGVDTTDEALGKIKPVEPKVKSLPDFLLELIKTDKTIVDYEKIQTEVKMRLLEKKVIAEKNDIRELVNASVLLISACQDWQFTKPGLTEKENSVFTAALKLVWEKNDFKNYLELHQHLWEEFENPPSRTDIQNPNYYRIGKPNSKFEMQKPFSI